MVGSPGPRSRGASSSTCHTAWPAAVPQRPSDKTRNEEIIRPGMSLSPLGLIGWEHDPPVALKRQRPPGGAHESPSIGSLAGRDWAQENWINVRENTRDRISDPRAVHGTLN